MPLYSLIIAVYNRPKEIEELLASLEVVTFKDFEVIVVEDGSEWDCETICNQYAQKNKLTYLKKQNTGQGFSRNEGSKLAKGDYLIFFDSDCLIPPTYFEEIEEKRLHSDLVFWGGPDKAHESFTVLQRAISFSMTSFLTTGGIRGNKNHAGNWQPRSFNMGIKKTLFEQVGGFHQTNLGEDIELSTRLFSMGIKADLFTESYVYHKRRNTLSSFYKQAFSFGAGRVITGKKNVGGIKLVHWFPSVFTIGVLILPLLTLMDPFLFNIGAFCFMLYFFASFVLSVVQNKNLFVAIMSVVTTFVQLTGYGIGFLWQFFR